MKKNLPSVQLLRAIAAISVCIVHCNTMYWMIRGHPKHLIVTYFMAAGVDLFFIISGFIIVLSSDRFFGQLSYSFFIRRLARIVPIYWVSTFIYIYIQHIHVDTEILLKSLAFIPYAQGNMQPIMGVGWTLNFEIFFYFLFGLALIFKKPISILLLSILLGVFALSNFIKPFPLPFYFWADPIIIEFVFGMCIALLYEHQIRFHYMFGIMLVISGILLICFLSPAHTMPPSSNRFIIWGLPAAMIMMGIVLSKPWSSKARIPAMVTSVGDASYSIYLLHNLILVLAQIFAKSHHKHPLLLVMFAGIITLPLSIYTYRYFEKPVTKFLVVLLLTRRFNSRLVIAKDGEY